MANLNAPLNVSRPAGAPNPAADAANRGAAAAKPKPKTKTVTDAQGNKHEVEVIDKAVKDHDGIRTDLKAGFNAFVQAEGQNAKTHLQNLLHMIISSL